MVGVLVDQDMPERRDECDKCRSVETVRGDDLTAS